MKKSTVILVLVFGILTTSAKALTYSTIIPANTIEKTEKITPLCKAVAMGDMDTVVRLINNGVNVNVKSNGMLPIHYAAKYNRVNMIKTLITAGSEIHLLCDKGYTALAHAKKSNAKEAEMFLRRFKK